VIRLAGDLVLLVTVVADHQVATELGAKELGKGSSF